MRILVTGATGAIGSELVPRLLAEGHHVRLASRRAHMDVPAGADFVSLDVVSGAGLERALAGIDVAYYLIHSMEPAAGDDFPVYERAAADHFASAAQRAGVRRTIYLGGLVPETSTPSPHLASRLAVEERLLAGTPEAVAFRASIVIGASSRSFRFLVRLVERLPVLVIPAWRNNVTAPIDMRDVVSFLAAAATQEDIGTVSLDIAGPDRISYGGLIERIRDLMLLPRPVINLPKITLTPIAAHVSSVIASEEYELIGPLMGGLSGDLLPRDDRAAELFSVRRHTLDAAIERALRDWERVEELKAR